MTIASFVNSIGFKVNDDDVRAVNQAYQDMQKSAEETAQKIQDTLGEATQKLVDNLDAVAKKMLENDAIQQALDRANQRMQEFEEMLGNTTDRSGQALQEGLDNANAQIGEAAGQGGEQLRDMGDEVGEYLKKASENTGNNVVQTANQTVNKVVGLARRLFAIFGIGLSLRSLNSIAEEFDGIGDRITYAAEGAENLDEIMQNILQSANNARTSYGHFASQVTALKQSNKELFPLEEAAKMVEYTTKLGKAAGYSDGEISSMNSIIKRIVANGKAGQMDITRLLRQTPAFAEMLAKALGTSTDKLGEMAKAGKITSETLKKAVMDSTESIDEAFAQLNFGVSDALTQIRNKFGVWIDTMNKQYDITQTVAKAMVKGYEAVMKVVDKAAKGFEKFSKLVGGAKNAIRLLTITAAAIWTVLNINKLKAFADGLNGLFDPKKLKIMALIAAVTFLFLLIQDFIYFMSGKGSLLGDMLAAAGIDADDVREKIFGIGDTIGTILEDGKKIAGDIITPIAEALGDVGKALGDITGIHTMDEFLALCGEGFNALVDYIADFVVSIAHAVTALSDLVNLLGLVVSLISTLEDTPITKWGETFSEFTKANGEYMGALANDVGAQYYANMALQNPFATKEEKAQAEKEAIEARKNRDKVEIRTRGARTQYTTNSKSDEQAEYERLIQFHNETFPKLTMGQKAAYFAGTATVGNVVGQDKVQGYFKEVADKNTQASKQMQNATVTGNKGIEATIRSVSQTIVDAIKSGMMKQIVSISQGSLNSYGGMKDLAGAGKASARTVNNTTRNSTNKTVNVTVNQNNTFNGDRGVQQNTSDAMQKATTAMTDNVSRAMAYTG